MEFPIRDFGRVPVATTAAMRFRSQTFAGSEGLGLISTAPSEAGIGPFVRAKSVVQSYSYARVGTLTAAAVFRDCSFRLQSSLPERRACRTLMRQAAIKWRRGVAMGDL